MPFAKGTVEFDHFIRHAHGNLCKHIGIDYRFSTDPDDRYSIGRGDRV